MEYKNRKISQGGIKVQTLSKSSSLSPDYSERCVNCQADLQEFSSAMVALKRLRENPRVGHVILSVFDDACPACQKMQGAYAKDATPTLPLEGCSHPNGCRCYYQPELTEIYP